MSCPAERLIPTFLPASRSWRASRSRSSSPRPAPRSACNTCSTRIPTVPTASTTVSPARCSRHLRLRRPDVSCACSELAGRSRTRNIGFPAENRSRASSSRAGAWCCPGSRIRSMSCGGQDAPSSGRLCPGRWSSRARRISPRPPMWCCRDGRIAIRRTNGPRPAWPSGGSSRIGRWPKWRRPARATPFCPARISPPGNRAWMAGRPLLWSPTAATWPCPFLRAATRSSSSTIRGRFVSASGSRHSRFSWPWRSCRFHGPVGAAVRAERALPAAPISPRISQRSQNTSAHQGPDQPGRCGSSSPITSGEWTRNAVTTTV